MKLKLLLIAPTCDGNDVGEAWMAYQWVKYLRDRHDVTLLTYHKRTGTPAASQFDGVRIIEWQEPPLLGRAERMNSIIKPAYIPFYIKARRWIRQALARGEQFDVAHQPLPEAMRYPCPAIGLGLPVIVGPLGGGLDTPPGFASDEGATPLFMKLRGIDKMRLRFDPLLRKTYSEADCVLGIASYVRDQLQGISLRRFEMLSDTGLDSLPERIDRSGRTGTVRLLYVGRLIRTKGARDILRALASLRDLDIHLDIVGDGPERADCEDMVRSMDLHRLATIHGRKPKPEVMQFYRNADIFVFPSYREPGGNVVFEAMAYSLPLIVADRGGPGSTASTACAIKLPISTPDALAKDLAQSIRNLVQNSELRLKMGAAAYEHGKKTALWSSKIDFMDQLYSEFSSRKRPNRVSFGDCGEEGAAARDNLIP